MDAACHSYPCVAEHLQTDNHVKWNTRGATRMRQECPRFPPGSLLKRVNGDQTPGARPLSLDINVTASTGNTCLRCRPGRLRNKLADRENKGPRQVSFRDPRLKIARDKRLCVCETVGCERTGSNGVLANAATGFCANNKQPPRDFTVPSVIKIFIF